MVMIPNYAAAGPNCVHATQLYSVCCRDDCEDLMQRLDEIAALHGGEVRIHGRLFSQFMHHAFPGECAFPHEAGSSAPITPDEWMGLDTEASEEERMQHLSDDTCGPEQAAAEWNVELPWSHAEELLTREAAVGMRS